MPFPIMHVIHKEKGHYVMCVKRVTACGERRKSEESELLSHTVTIVMQHDTALNLHVSLPRAPG